MGWEEVTFSHKDSPLLRNIDPDPRYYFVHSYYVTCSKRENSLATATYGITFDCGLIRENIMGLQFHPEKSHRFGMEIMRNFVENF
jgi:glutamine amidotransferase